VAFLLDHGAGVDVCTRLGDTPLMCAARRGRVDVAVMLLDRGAGIDVTHDESRRTPLILAAFMSKPDMIELLVSRGADVNAATADGDTVLIVSSRVMGNVDIVKILLSVRDIDVDRQNVHGKTALMYAAAGSHVEMTALLLDAGADSFLQDKHGMRASDLTRDKETRDVLERAEAVYMIRARRRAQQKSLARPDSDEVKDSANAILRHVVSDGMRTDPYRMLFGEFMS
jgi:ankyrin repeat protein